MVTIDPQVYWSIRVACRAVDVPESLGFGLAMVESGMNPYAVGDAGDSIGLLQINSRFHRNPFGPSAMLSPMLNAATGMRFLAECIAGTGTVPDGISAYNQGLTGWRTNGIETNLPYVERVLGWAAYFETEGVSPGSSGWKFVEGIENGPYPV